MKEACFAILKPGRVVVLAVICLIALNHPVCGQQATGPESNNSYKELVEQSFGYDQNLVNGIQYFSRYTGCKGIPYFISDAFVAGDLTIQGRVYKNVKIRYDLLSQCVELEYENTYGGFSRLVTVSDHISAFRFQDFLFEKLTMESPSGKFYQVIEIGRYTCYIHWERKLIPLQNDRSFTKIFSDAKSTTHFELDGEFNVINGKEEFIQLFPENRQKEIKRFLKSMHFRFKNASPTQMISSMNGVANLLKSGGLP